MSLREKLKALEELQRVDVELYQLGLKAEALPRKERELNAKVQEARRGYEAEKAKLLQNEKEHRQVDSLLAMEKEKVKKWESRLAEIKTPREYAALSREIEIAKKSNETQQEQAKLLTEGAGELRKKLDSMEVDLAGHEQSLSKETTELQTQQSEFQARMKELTAQREAEAKKVDPSLLSKYENIKRKRAGVAVVPVIGTTCSGCNMNIPPQLSNILRRADTIELCPNCNRIIYSAEAVNPPAASPA